MHVGWPNRILSFALTCQKNCSCISSLLVQTAWWQIEYWYWNSFAALFKVFWGSWGATFLHLMISSQLAWHPPQSSRSVLSYVSTAWLAIIDARCDTNICLDIVTSQIWHLSLSTVSACYSDTRDGTETWCCPSTTLRLVSHWPEDD